jgi:DNA repair protein SbcD/Mre11
VKVLCTGDLHIGRGPSRLPSSVEVRPLSCARRWEAIVECALTQQVDLVAISGDLVDRQNRYFEAIGPLEKGLRRLGDAGVVTVAVAGNHDFDVLPEIAQSLGESYFHLLGRGGAWERKRIQLRNGDSITVDGWSFAQEHVRANPLDSYALGAADGEIHMGLLHADLGAPTSTYAPVSLADLRAHPTNLWLLGHIHAPRLEGGIVPVLYPGSPQAMDPGESGAHGVWVGEMCAGEPAHLQMVRLSAVRYETIDINVSDASDEVALMASAHAQIQQSAAAFIDSAEGLKHLSLRIRVCGATSMYHRIDACLHALETDAEISVGDVGVWVERIVNQTRPARDLVDLSRGEDAPALLARLLLMLSGDRDATESELAILREAEQAATHARKAKPYLALGDGKADDASYIREVVAAQAAALLDELLRESPSHGATA